MSELIELFERAIDGFAKHVHRTTDAQWHDPTPDTEWDVRMLTNHVTVEQLWVPPLIGGSTVEQVGDRFDGDQLGDDPIATWDAASEASVKAFRSGLDRTVSLASGERPAAEYCWEMTVDALIHSWDLARGIHADDTLDPELSQLVYDRTLPMAEQLQDSGLFAPPVPVADDSSLQVRLLAIFGRDARIG
jgi:uncharacterized protein (TIGR03086 family)